MGTNYEQISDELAAKYGRLSLEYNRQLEGVPEEGLWRRLEDARIACLAAAEVKPPTELEALRALEECVRAAGFCTRTGGISAALRDLDQARAEHGEEAVNAVNWEVQCEKLRAEVASLKEQLADRRAACDEWSRICDRQDARVTELSEQLAEADNLVSREHVKRAEAESKLALAQQETDAQVADRRLADWIVDGRGTEGVLYVALDGAKVQACREARERAGKGEA